MNGSAYFPRWQVNIPFKELKLRIANLPFRAACAIAVAVSVVASTSPLVLAQGGGNPLNPNTAHYPLTYAQWSARWVQWAFSIPRPLNPVLDTTGANCAVGQFGPVWFLAGTFGTTVTRSCTIPANTGLFFPIIATDCNTQPPRSGSTEAELRSCASGTMDAVLADPATSISAEIDGRPVSNLDRFRVVSPLFTVTDPPNGVSGQPGMHFSVGDGVFLLLSPLSPGMHTIRFRAHVPAFNFLLDVTYNLTVGS